LRFKAIQEELSFHSGKTSELVRQFAFAGFAVIWVFKEGAQRALVPSIMIPSAVLFGFTLLADLAQYATLTRKWAAITDKADEAYKLARQSDSDIDPENFDFRVNRDVHKWGENAFRFKLCFVAAGYGWLIIALTIKFAQAA